MKYPGLYRKPQRRLSEKEGQALSEFLLATPERQARRKLLSQVSADFRSSSAFSRHLNYVPILFILDYEHGTIPFLVQFA